jgi:hypothetical protein
MLLTLGYSALMQAFHSSASYKKYLKLGMSCLSLVHSVQKLVKKLSHYHHAGDSGGGGI